MGGLSDHEHFADMITSQKEFDGTEIMKEIFNMTIVEQTLQTHSGADGGM